MQYGMRKAPGSHKKECAKYMKEQRLCFVQRENVPSSRFFPFKYFFFACTAKEEESTDDKHLGQRIFQWAKKVFKAVKRKRLSDICWWPVKIPVCSTVFLTLKLTWWITWRLLFIYCLKQASRARKKKLDADQQKYLPLITVVGGK